MTRSTSAARSDASLASRAGESYIVALDKSSGETVWKVPREHKTRSYVTPIIRNVDGQDQLVFSGSKSVVSLDPATGETIWTIDGPTEQFVASMVYDGERFFMAAVRWHQRFGVRLLNHPFLRYLGLLSYSMYLLHTGTLWWLEETLHFPQWKQCLVGLPFLILAGTAIHRFIEKPVAKLRRRFVR